MCRHGRAEPNGLDTRLSEWSHAELGPNLSVASADVAARQFVAAGGTLLVTPFDIAIGRCTVVQDRWGNRLVLLDHTRGRLLIDATGRVRVGAEGKPATQASPG